MSRKEALKLVVRLVVAVALLALLFRNRDLSVSADSASARRSWWFSVGWV
jgi:hypothetical protein